MAKKYQGNKPAKKPVEGEFENYIADEFGQATINCLRKGEELGLEKRQVKMIMGFAYKQLGKQGNTIIGLMSAEIQRVAAEIKAKKESKKVPVDPKTLKPVKTKKK